MEVKKVTVQALNYNQMNPEDIFKWIEQFSFKRRVLNHWMDPGKSEKYVEWMEDNKTPAQLFPGMIVPTHHHREVMVLIEERMYEKLKAAFKENIRKVKPKEDES